MIIIIINYTVINLFTLVSQRGTKIKLFSSSQNPSLLFHFEHSLLPWRLKMISDLEPLLNYTTLLWQKEASDILSKSELLMFSYFT